MDPENRPEPPPIVAPPPVVTPPPARDGLGGFLEQIGQALTSATEAVTAPARSYELLLQVRQAMNTPGDPSVTFVKRTRCPDCGASKTLPPQTAYVYCDYCGNLFDYDFQVACMHPESSMPGPAYEALLRTLHPAMEQAKAQEDVVAYREIQSRLFTQWVELCPKAVSPRAKDPDYRSRLIAYMAETAVTNDFDPGFRELANQVAVRTAQMQWIGSFPKPTAESDAFWALYEAVRAQVDYSFGLLELREVTAMHPDGASPRLQAAITWSMFAQGWIPYLNPDDTSRLLLETGLYGEYSRLEPKETTLKHCGSCGSDLRVLPGARAVLCEGCGRRIDVESDETNCASCGGLLAFPVGESRVTCPYCRSLAIRLG